MFSWTWAPERAALLAAGGPFIWKAEWAAARVFGGPMNGIT
jgi:hypothetical protein